MAKTNSKVPPAPQPAKNTPETPAPIPAPQQPSWVPAWLQSFGLQAVVVAILSFAAYCNTFDNEYALDDLIVIVKNEYVYEGFAGLNGIFTKDAFESYCRETGTTDQLSGGRYRPLSIASFAAEQQFLGPIKPEMADSVMSHAMGNGLQERQLIHNMHVRHVFNVLWFTLSMVVLLYFLRYVVFRNNYLLAFIATLLFALHPLHTEVVANVKSRDEIMSLLFICATFIFAFKYRENRKMWQLGAALACYLLAFLAKEYAAASLMLLPLSFVLFAGDSWGRSLRATIPFVAVALLYFGIRTSSIGTGGKTEDSNDVWNNPYALATEGQKVPTKIATTLNYLALVALPTKLSSDYSYNTISYKGWGHPLVWVSLLVHLALAAGIWYFLKRDRVLAFALALYLLHLLLVCNVIYDIGGTMGERLAYHSSLGFCIALAWLLGMAASRLNGSARALAIAVPLLFVLGFYGAKTVARNPQWKNNYTLFMADVQTVPNSLLVNANLGSAVLGASEQVKDTAKKAAMLHQAIGYLDKASQIDSLCIPAYMNKGICYFKLKNADSARKYYETSIRLFPGYPTMPEMFFNVGVLFYFEKRYKEAIEVWKEVLQLKPSYEQARQNINIANHDMMMRAQGGVK